MSETLTAPVAEQPYTEAELEKFDAMTAQTFKKVGEKGEDLTPGFQYRVISVHHQFTDIGDENYILVFSIVKEHRDKFAKIKQRLPGGQEREVDTHKIAERYSPEGKLKEPDTGAFIKARDFAKQFKAI